MGPQDAAHFLTFLDIPRMPSFSNQQFTRIENVIGKELRAVADQSMEDMLEVEIKKTLEEKNMSYDEFKNDNKQKIGLTVSYDMGWSKRSSGHRYDSISGHSFFIGGKSKKVIAAQVSSKKCKICENAEKKQKNLLFTIAPKIMRAHQKVWKQMEP